MGNLDSFIDFIFLLAGVYSIFFGINAKKAGKDKRLRIDKRKSSVSPPLQQNTSATIKKLQRALFSLFGV